MALTRRGAGIVFDSILNGKPSSPSRLNRTVPAQLEHIIERGLEKDRGLRFQTARDMKSELQRLKRDLDSRASSGTSPAPQAATPRGARSYKRIGWLGAGFAILALLVLFATLISPPPIPSPTGS